MASPIKTSVVLSTYNAPDWLEKTLWGFFQQTRRDFEILVADDGSRPDTLARLRDIARRSPVPLAHVWQPDEGFQKCRILNKAIAVARGERLLLTDGDCIPRADFVDVHARLGQPTNYLSGGYFKLPLPVAEAIAEADLQTQRPFQARWLLDQGMPWSPRLWKLAVRPPFDEWLNRLTSARRTWNGHNASCLRRYALQVNGFEEQMQYGGEDVEFGFRLAHIGLEGRRMRFSTVTLHLHHERGYVTPGMRERNIGFMQRTLRDKRTRAELGLDQWLAADGQVTLGADDRVQWLVG